MKNHLAIVSATEQEIEPFLQYLDKEATQHTFQTYQLHGLTIDVIRSGIGILQTTYTVMDYLSHRHPDVWIQAGIGGAFDHSLGLGSIYAIESEFLSGFGAEDANGKIMDPFTLGWSDPDGYPYTAGRLICPYKPVHPFSFASGMTTFYAHGHQGNIDALRNQEHGQIENMEGAPFFYVSLLHKIPFISLRSISNLVEERNKDRWRMDLAIEQLSASLITMLEGARFKTSQLINTSLG